MRSLILCLCLAAPTHALCAELYKCTGPSGIPSYVSKPIQGHQCEFVSRYTPSEGRWRYVATGLDGAAISFDKETALRSSGTRTVWVQTNYGQKTKYVNGVGAVQKSLARVRFSCPAMSSETLSFADYGSSGDLLKSGTYTDPGPATPIAPDSIYEAVWQAVCTPSPNKPD